VPIIITTVKEKVLMAIPLLCAALRHQRICIARGGKKQATGISHGLGHKHERLLGRSTFQLCLLYLAESASAFLSTLGFCARTLRHALYPSPPTLAGYMYHCRRDDSEPFHNLHPMARKKFKKSKAPRSSPIPKPSLPRKELPAWYEHVSRLVASRELESENYGLSDGPYPEDFDEDISELESESGFACHCASDASDCECDLDERDFTDEDSVYAEYKEMREERQRELAELRKDQERTIEYHKAREDEVEKAWTELKESRTQGVEAQKLSLELAHFTIYSSEYVRSWDMAYDHGTSYIEIYSPDEFDERTDNTQVVGHIYFDANITPDLEAFEVPKYAGLCSINIGVKGSDANVTVTFINQFLLKMVVPRSIAYPRSPPPNTPELLEFVGISKNFENERTRQEKREREEAEARCRKQREVSPRESWFEMNHPMGSWAQSGW
jgi:hypothetical protein